jgi:hypothetical protein
MEHILNLLSAGFIAGPITGFLKTDEVLGELLFPFVSVGAIYILKASRDSKLQQARFC